MGNKSPEFQDIMTDKVFIGPSSLNSATGSLLHSEEYARSILRLEVATYIGQMTAELATMARNSDLPLLSYFLDMAAAEARAADDKLRDVLKVGPDPEARAAVTHA
ncbi:MAG: hypothetical protein ACRCUE_11935 [Bosea sp. (in: a-proteobacteria)]